MSWALAIAGFAVLIIAHEAGHMLVAKAVGMRVERFFLFFPPRLVSVRRGETEYGIGAIPLGGFVKITGMNPDEEIPDEVRPRAYYSQPVWKRIVVIAAGPAVNIVLAFAILFALGFGAEEPTEAVGETRADLPASRHLEPGDRITSVDGTSVAGLEGTARRERIAELINEHACAGEHEDGCRAATPVELEVERDGEAATVSMRPEFDAAAPTLEGEPGGRMLLGFSYGTRPVDVSVPEAAEFAGDRMWLVTSRTGEVFARIFDAEQREQITGVVGATEATRQAFEFDMRTALGLIAIISLSLGLVNLAPFLPLDGGHIFWGVVEKVRGRPVPFSVMERSGVIGFVLVIMIFFIGLTNDIGRLTGEGINIR